LSELLQDYVAQQAERRADETALVMADEHITYGEVELTSNRVARVLLEAGARAGDRVCLLSEKSPTAVLAMLGVLKAGCMYVPLDVASPAARVARVMSAAEPRIALVSAAGAPLLAELVESRRTNERLVVGALDEHPRVSLRAIFGPSAIAAAGADRPPSTGTDESGAYIMFTSGSTGDPKGVLITHRNVRAFVDWAVSYFGIKAGDRNSGHPPLHFDLSTFDIFGTFAAGAELHLVPPSLLLPRELAEFVTSSRLTQWFSVPSAMSYMARFGGLPDEGFPSLERVLWCGEVLATPVLIEWMRRVPKARFTNLYGPTEATISSSYYTVPEIPKDAAAPVPIGRACPGEELVVLDEQGRELEVDEIGELHIGGVGLSPGYWRQEELTRATFVADPRPGRDAQRLYRTGDLARRSGDSLMCFLGRLDSQIKSRGYRIELGEIETAVNDIDGVAECAVVAITADGFEGAAICCAFVSVAPAQLTPAQVRTILQRSLPGYMIPSRWDAMAALPKNVNGKIDRRRVRELFEERTGR
jgi:amino acid adenylation domain-containing protein